jgi:hypothetical protein
VLDVHSFAPTVPAGQACLIAAFVRA